MRAFYRPALNPVFFGGDAQIRKSEMTSHVAYMISSGGLLQTCLLKFKCPLEQRCFTRVHARRTILVSF